MNKLEIISEIALRCGDRDFDDFEQGVYLQAYYRANRSLGKKYNIYQKLYTFTPETIDDDIVLDIPDFKSEHRVWVNGKELRRLSNRIEDTIEHRDSYYIDYVDTDLLFNYRLKDGKSESDEIAILYEITPDKETDDGEYAIPTLYEEELIEHTLVYLSKMGMVQFSNEKKAKYRDLYQIVVGEKNRNEYDKDLRGKSREWIEVKPFQYP